MSLLGYNDEEDSTTINKRRCEMKQENDPVLAAIDKAKWDDEDLDTFNILSNCDRSNAILRANTQIEAIRTAYLANKQQPSDGWAFERVIAGIPFAAVKMFAGDIADITAAHNADRAADKQRIAELEKNLKQRVTELEGRKETQWYLQKKVEELESERDTEAKSEERHQELRQYADAIAEGLGTSADQTGRTPSMLAGCVRQRITELEARNKELMCAMREWYEDGFNRGDCGELIVKHGGDA